MADNQQKKEKKTRNVLKDMIWDYYKTNREITKGYDEQYKKEKEEGGQQNKKWTGSEKLYTAIIVIGLILILIKYVIL